MHREFIAAIISASIAITAFSANSAAAGDRDTANFLAGLAGLAIIGAIIHDSNKRTKLPITRPVTLMRRCRCKNTITVIGLRHVSTNINTARPHVIREMFITSQSKDLYRTACRAKSCRAIASAILSPVADNSGSLAIAV